MSGDIVEIMGYKVDVKKVSNRALRRVIGERAECNDFMFRGWGGRGYRDYKEKGCCDYNESAYSEKCRCSACNGSGEIEATEHTETFGEKYYSKHENVKKNCSRCDEKGWTHNEHRYDDWSQGHSDYG